MTHARTADEARVIDYLVVAGWAKDFLASPASARDAASTALERWVRAGLPFSRLPGGERGFDPAEVMNFAKSAGVSGRDEFWSARYVETGRSLVREFGAQPQELGPRGFRLRLERAFNLEHHAPGKRVRLRVPFPADSPMLTELQSLSLPAGSRTQPGYAEAFVVVPESRACVLSADYAFAARPAPSPGVMPLDAAELDLYLRPRELLVTVSPRIEALASELAGGARTALDAVRSFWSFFFDRMMLGVLHGETTLDAVLDSGWFDCRTGSSLLVALCRARGIPARACSGFTLCSVPSYHYWAEIWLGERGWFPLDLVCWDLSLRGADEGWRDYFFGALDYRMTFEVQPRTFAGLPSIRLPRGWYPMTRPIEGGAAFGLFAAESGSLVYEDRVTVNANAGPLLP